MTRKQNRSTLVRIEKATRIRKHKFTSSLQDFARESIPGEMVTTIQEYPAVVPTGLEFELLQDVLASSDKVYYKPRRRQEYIIDSSHLKKWQIAGFEHYANYVGYCQTWGLSQHTQDFDILFDDKEITHD